MGPLPEGRTGLCSICLPTTQPELAIQGCRTCGTRGEQSLLIMVSSQTILQRREGNQCLSVWRGGKSFQVAGLQQNHKMFGNRIR